MIEVLHQWQFYNPVKIYTGRSSRVQLVEQLNGKKLLIVTTVRGKSQFLKDSVLSEVIKNNQVTWVDTVKENPGLTDLQAEIDQLNSLRIEAIIAFGGGSAIDAGKTLRIGLAVQGKYSLAELLENSALHKEAQQVPLYALPTTAGTGSEVTPFATVWHHEKHKKLSLSGDNIFPSVAIVDAELTDSLPTKVTLSTGLDAINQAAESVWNKNANSITLALAARSLKLGLKALPLLVEGKGGKQERDQMAESSLLAGLAISHTRTALCHSISYPLTAYFGVPHGLACAFTMAEVCKLNLSSGNVRFTVLAQFLTGKADVQELQEVFLELNKKLKITDQVRCYIAGLDDLLILHEEMHNPSRASNNLVGLEVGDLLSILSNSWFS